MNKLTKLLFMLGFISTHLAHGGSAPPPGELEALLDVQQTSYNRHWTWAIDKDAGETELTLSPGQEYTVNYQVGVSAGSSDSDFTAQGALNITYRNDAYTYAMAWIQGISAAVTPDNLALGVDCPSGQLMHQSPVSCSWSTTISGPGRSITADVSWYDYYMTRTTTAGPVPVTFGDLPADEVDECIEVTDSGTGYLGTVCSDETPHMFTYPWKIGPFDCGEHNIENTAGFETNDTQQLDEDTLALTVHVPCDAGCTLSHGYWKTHSELGPASYDDAWAQLPLGAVSLFHNSGLTYHEILRTPPSGDAWYLLAQAYIVAELNRRNGAMMPPHVADAHTAAGELLAQYVPGQLRGGRNKSERAIAIGLSTQLKSYNDGATDPGPCSEDESSAS